MFGIDLAIVNLATAVLLMVQPWGTGTIASSASPDGTLCVVEQRFNGWDAGGEWYTVTQYAKRPGKEWEERMLDFEAGRWKTCKITFSEDGTRINTIGGDRKRPSFELGTGTPSGGPRYWKLQMQH